MSRQAWWPPDYTPSSSGLPSGSDGIRGHPLAQGLPTPHISAVSKQGPQLRHSEREVRIQVLSGIRLSMVKGSQPRAQKGHTTRLYRQLETMVWPQDGGHLPRSTRRPPGPGFHGRREDRVCWKARNDLGLGTPEGAPEKSATRFCCLCKNQCITVATPWALSQTRSQLCHPPRWVTLSK